MVIKMIKKLKNYYKYCRDKRYDTLAGTLSFFFILSFIPLLYLGLTLYVKLGNIWHIETPLPEILKNYITFDINAGFSILFVLTTIYSSSALFLQLRRTGEIIYGVKKPQSPLKMKIVSCGIVLIAICITAVGLLTLSLAQNLLHGTIGNILIKILSVAILYLILFAFLVLVNQYATIQKLTKSEMKYGVIFTLIYITIVSIGFYIYVSMFANYNALYGFFSTIIIAILYIYLMMKGVVCGIIINERRYKKIKKSN